MLTEADKANAYFVGASVAVKLVPKATDLEEEGYMCGSNQLVHKINEVGFGLVWLAVREILKSPNIRTKDFTGLHSGKPCMGSFITE